MDIKGGWPFVERKEAAKRDTLIPSGDNDCVQVGFIDATHEFPADTAGRQNVELASGFIDPDRDHLGDPVVPGCNHGRHSAALRAQAPSWSIDRDACEHLTAFAQYGSAHIAE